MKVRFQVIQRSLPKPSKVCDAAFKPSLNKTEMAKVRLAESERLVDLLPLSHISQMGAVATGE